MAKAIQETRDVGPFDALTLKGMGDIFLTQGENESLILEGEPDLLERIKTEVSGSELIISLKSWLDLLIIPKNLKIYVTMRNVRGVKVSGSGTLNSARISTDHLKLEASGSADMQIGDLSAENLEMGVSGSGKFKLAGKVTSQDVHISGSGRYEGKDLDCQTASVRVSGSCHATLRVQESLNVKISGSADVGYVGNPKLQQRVSGSASIHQIA